MTDDLRELYQEVIIDHGRRPRNFRKIDHATCSVDGYNPLCGDMLTLYVSLENDCVKDVSFEGAGCAISMASASLLSEAVKNKTIAEANHLFEAFHQLVTDNNPPADTLTKVGKLAVLAGVKEFPMRVKCATLAWHALHNAITQSSGTVSTE
jgi:nitrogen fixation protein NifU and related proteins